MTYPTLEEVLAMDKQALFNHITKHLLSQGKRSEAPFVFPKGGSTMLCQYRGEGETACAIGSILPESIYEPALEGALGSLTIKLEHSHSENGGAELSKFIDKHYSLLVKFQHIHDGAEVHLWPHCLKSLAKEWMLKDTVEEIRQSLLSQVESLVAA